MRLIHGQSEHTPNKQAQLQAVLDACKYAWGKDHSWASAQRWFIDGMAGAGYSDEGAEGSPLVLYKCARNLQRNNPKLLVKTVWCDLSSNHVEQLRSFGMENVSILQGRFQEQVRTWIDENGCDKEKVMGLLYLDDNGCKQIWQDDGLIDRIMVRHPHLDIALHFSVTAWRRSKGAGIGWAKDQTVTDLMWQVARRKPGSVIFIPDGGRWGWRLIFGCKSTKMNLCGYQRTKLITYLHGQRIQEEMFHGTS